MNNAELQQALAACGARVRDATQNARALVQGRRAVLRLRSSRFFGRLGETSYVIPQAGIAGDAVGILFRVYRKGTLDFLDGYGTAIYVPPQYLEFVDD